jgi:nucleoside-diphosphate-sugar epimerase/glyoxylase-like metal-dependent hydrolase (beta-lactamase superfamily II)
VLIRATGELEKLLTQTWGPQPRRVLITGGTGFVGWRLAEVLAAAGQNVTILGRNRYRAPWKKLGVELVVADINDSTKLREAFRGQDLVFHAAALSEPWGRRDDFLRTNVDGTSAVVAACIEAKPQRLIHISSTAVFFEYRDRPLVADSDPLANQPSCHYAATKIQAEAIVHEAATLNELDTFTVRARAVFGPRDPSLLPRIIEAAKAGRLRQIGPGKNEVDLTYVDNLVAGLILAAVRGEAGGCCTITNQEPVPLWPTIRQFLGLLGMEIPRTAIPAWLAHSIGAFSELRHSILGTRGQPRLTRYAVGLLRHTQTFDSTNASRALGYQPIVPMPEALKRTATWLRRTDEHDADVRVKLRMLSTGYTPQAAKHIEHGAAQVTWRMHAGFALIEHPTEGRSLFDTGYSTRFFQATANFPARGYRWLTQVETRKEWSAVEQLRSMGVEPESIRRVIISHFHGDHIGGLRDFPDADFIAPATAWEQARGRSGLSAIKHGYLPSLLPDDFANRLHLVDSFHSPGFGSLEQCHDLFGDGAIRLFDLSGHVQGQIGALLQDDAGHRQFLVADASWTRRTIYEALPLTLPFRCLAESRQAAVTTHQRLAQFHQQFPEIEMLPTHCPEVAQQYGYDTMLAETEAAGIGGSNGQRA